MIIKGDNFVGGRVIEQMVSLIDLPKTVMSCAGQDVGDAMRGIDLNQVVSGEATPREYVFYQISESGVAIGENRPIIECSV